MKRINLFSALLIVAAALCAQPSATYYSSANGQSGDALRTALMNIIDGHTVVSYDNLKELYKYSDTKENDADTRNMLIDIYSECTYTPGSAYCGSGSCGGYNREHSVPKSWFNEASPMYSDAFHLYPTSCYVNSYRGNYALGECSGGEKCTSNGMTEALGRRGSCTYPGYSAVVYEPDDKYKGDLARTYFYMATRYADQCSSWSGGMFGSDNNGFQTWAINMLLEWHRADPVSEKEKIRNEAIFGNTKYNTGAYSQGNRNPFIDYPCLAEYIWGNKKGETVDFSTLVLSYDASFADTENQCGCQVSTTPILTSPRGSVAFGAVEVNTTTTQTITVQGRNLTNNVTLTLSGTNADLFSLSATTVSADEAVAGKTITITYEPTSEGNHTATLTLSSTDAASVEVTLTGNGASTYTITYNAGNGTCGTTQSTELSVGAGVELPTATPAASCTDWTFAGWSTTAVIETQTAPELLQAGDMYHPTANGVLYAVYKMTEGGTGGSTNVVFNVSDIATKNSWVNGTKYSSYTIDGITISYSGGDNDGKYYSSDNSWRSYANGSVVVSGTTTISNVISEPSQTFSKESDGTWKYTGTGKVQFTQFTITVSGTGGPTTYATSPSCQTCTLDGIELNTANVTTAFFVGDKFTSEGLVVTALYSGCDAHIVVPTSVSTPDMSSAGTQTVTVSYTENGITKTAGYNVAVNAKPTYTITLNQNAGGTIKADVSSATAGTVVTLTATANAHYTFSEWAVLDGEANDITVTYNQFVMPASDVEVEATFAEIQYAISTTLTHVTPANDNPTTAGVSDDNILMVFDAETGYQLPTTIEVKMGNELLTAGYDYEWTANGMLNIVHTGGITAPLYITIKATPIQYEILFLDDDNTTELALVQVSHGEVPSYPNATPTKPSTDQYDYTFSGWSPALMAAVDDAIYVAVYTQTVRQYTVTFVDFDGKVLDKQSVAYGSAANAPQNPTRVGYTFAGWDKEFNKITSDLTVTATYTKDTETRVDGAIADAPIVYVANGVLHVSGLPTGASLTVFDCTGRLVEQRTAATDTETFALTNGLYLVRIQANGEQRTLKIVL